MICNVVSLRSKTIPKSSHPNFLGSINHPHAMFRALGFPRVLGFADFRVSQGSRGWDGARRRNDGVAAADLQPEGSDPNVARQHKGALYNVPLGVPLQCPCLCLWGISSCWVIFQVVGHTTFQLGEWQVYASLCRRELR